MKHVMIDIEALRLKEVWRAPLMEVGMCLFSDKGEILDHALIPIKILSIPSYFKAERETVAWWKKQDQWEPLQLRMKEHGLLISDALRKIIEILNDWDFDGVWFAGPTYDQVCLESYFDFFSLEIPWKFYQSRDFRTMRKQFPELASQFPENPSLHSALDDSINQVQKLEVIYRSTGRLIK